MIELDSWEFLSALDFKIFYTSDFNAFSELEYSLCKSQIIEVFFEDSV